MSRDSAELQTICKQYWQRLFNLEGDKFDLEHIEKVKAQEVNKGCYLTNQNKMQQQLFEIKKQQQRYFKTYLH